jgi:hypothetical protein
MQTDEGGSTQSYRLTCLHMQAICLVTWLQADIGQKPHICKHVSFGRKRTPFNAARESHRGFVRQYNASWKPASIPLRSMLPQSSAVSFVAACVFPC